MSISFSSVISERNKNENAVHESEKELRDFVDNVYLGLHWVSSDGKILWANNHELELLGYDKDEYLGKNISEIHVDQAKINDILSRLRNNEIIKDCEAQIKCKDGSIRDVIILANVYWKNGQFIHSRCFTRDITEKKLQQIKAQRGNA
jgi:PAS domain S-box-containing protein